MPYPLPKLDHIAVPGGFGGAMENWGGITYYESRLLFDPEKSSAETKQGIYEVIAHEIAHKWFGDLVTMAWWDNLWLNEGFASWMGTKCTAKFNPDWEVWLSKNVPRDPTRRDGIGKESAMEGDARSTTHPIQQPIATEAEANSAFDDITYQKGLSFIRCWRVFSAKRSFATAFANTWPPQIFEHDHGRSLERARRSVGQTGRAKSRRPGPNNRDFPVVKVARDASGKITLTQERFTVHFENAPPLEWKIPLTYSVVGEAAPASLLMTSKTIDLPAIPADRAVKLNVEGAGNYRVQYDEASWKLLLGELPKLSSADRVNLLCDAWALVQANRAPLSLYLELVEKLPAKTELAEREQIMHVFDFINRLLAGEPQREQFQKYARSILRPSFEQVGWEPKSGEPHQDRFAARQPDQRAGRSERRRDRGRLSRAFPKVSVRSEIARARFASARFRRGRALRRRSDLEQAARAGTENDQHRGETKLLRRARVRARSEARRAHSGDRARRRTADQPRDLPCRKSGAAKRASRGGLAIRQGEHEDNSSRRPTRSP